MHKNSLFDTTVSMANADNYKKNLKKCGIHCQSLASVKDDDLLNAGVDDDKIRRTLLKLWKELDPDDPDDEDEPELDDVMCNNNLKIINNELQMLYAYLSYTAHRRNCRKSQVKLSKCGECLFNISVDLESKIQSLYDEEIHNPPLKDNGKWKFVLPVIISIVVPIFLFKRYFSH